MSNPVKVSWLRRLRARLVGKNRSTTAAQLPATPRGLLAAGTPTGETALAVASAAIPAIAPDAPLLDSSQDRFRRKHWSNMVAQALLATTRHQSMVAAVQGGWGTGKTTELNRISTALAAAGVHVLHFNPWFFSSTHDLVNSFFQELGRQLELKDSRLASAGALLQMFGHGLKSLTYIPGLPAAFGNAADATKEYGSALEQSSRLQTQSLSALKNRLEESLRKADARIVVVLDDVDRLDEDEVRDIVRLTRLVADLPNICYLLAYDVARVEHVIGRGDRRSGRLYLEKIVQLTFDLPSIGEADLRHFLFSELDHCLGQQKHGHWDERLWPDVAHGIILPLIRTPRDVRRYVGAITVALSTLADEVAAVDLFALEAIRLFVPDAFRMLQPIAPLLTMATDMVSGSRHHRRSEADQQLVMAFVNAGPERVMRELIRRVFPHGQRFISSGDSSGIGRKEWTTHRRACLGEVLNLYLQAGLPPEVVSKPMCEAIQNAARTGKTSELRELCASIPPEQSENLIERLEETARDIASLGPTAAADTLDAVTTVANRLPKRRSGPVFLSPDLAMKRLGYQVIANVPAPERAIVFNEMIARMESMTWCIEILRSISSKNDSLIDQVTYNALEAALTEEIEGRAKTPEKLAGERSLFLTLGWARVAKGQDSAPIAAAVSDPAILLQVLQTSISVRTAQEFDSAYVKRIHYVPWPDVAKIAGGGPRLQATLELALDAAKSSPDGTDAVVKAIETALADKIDFENYAFDEDDDSPADGGAEDSDAVRD